MRSAVVSLSSTGFALLGALLVAISFGLARFAFGLYVPPIREELGLSALAIGLISALPLLSFLLSSALAPWLTDRLGARLTALISTSFAVLGLGLISTAWNPMMLAIGVFACGLCTGLMMPALTAAMQVLVRRSLQGRVSAILNAGTSVGIMIAVPTVLLLTEAWRVTYLGFAMMAAVGAVAAWLLLPSVSRIVPANVATPAPLPELPWSRLVRLALFCFTTGFISSAYWIFAPDLVTTLSRYPAQASALLWLAVGLAGLGGAVIADLADRNNPPITQALMIMILAASMALLAASPNQILLSTFSALMFGLAYMSLSGLHLMTGIRLLPGRLAAGPVVPFMAIAVGQAVGSPIAGRLIQTLGHADAFAVFAALGVTVAILSPFYPGSIAQADEDYDTDYEGLQGAIDQQMQTETGEPLADFMATDSAAQEPLTTET